MSHYYSSTSDLYDAINEAYGDEFPEVVKRNLALNLSSAGYTPWDIPSSVVDIVEDVSVDEYRQLLRDNPNNGVFLHQGYCFLLDPVDD